MLISKIASGVHLMPGEESISAASQNAAQAAIPGRDEADYHGLKGTQDQADEVAEDNVSAGRALRSRELPRHSTPCVAAPPPNSPPPHPPTHPPAQEFIENYRQARLEQLKYSTTYPRFGEIRECDPFEFGDEVDNADPRCFVIVHMYEPHVDACKKINRLLEDLARRMNWCKVGPRPAPAAECSPLPAAGR
jgi:hypothetical protein